MLICISYYTRRIGDGAQRVAVGATAADSSEHHAEVRMRLLILVRRVLPLPPDLIFDASQSVWTIQ